MDLYYASIEAIKLVAIFLLMVQLVPLLVWAERRGSAFIQNRFGPNRVGPLGLIQTLADAVKFAFKEEFIPDKSYRFLFYFAPIVALIPGTLAFCALPLSIPFELQFGDWGPYVFKTQGYDFGIGIVFVLGVSSLGAYSLLMAGWGSANKYSLFGALRASAQMISYELGLGLSLVGILLIYGTFSFNEMVILQDGPMNFAFMGEQVVVPFLPNWGIFYQPLGALLFFVSAFAESNRLPFDLPEAEAELVAGYHTEYGGLKMLMFYIGEYGHMMVASGLFVTFFLGGYDLPFATEESVRNLVLGMIEGIWGANQANPNSVSLLTMLVFHISFMTKVMFLLWVFIWVRWTLPRFRYDQLMDLGWKKILPWALANTVVTAFVVTLFRTGV